MNKDMYLAYFYLNDIFILFSSSDIAEILGHKDTKVISDENLADLVRQIAVNCNVRMFIEDVENVYEVDSHRPLGCTLHSLSKSTLLVTCDEEVGFFLAVLHFSPLHL